MVFARSFTLLLALLAAPLALAEFDWKTALSGEHRAEGNAARNDARHPKATLEFFGLEPGMTVMEMSPGGGWYTEVLAPLMMGNGTYIAAHNNINGSGYSRRSLGGFLKKLGENHDLYGEVQVVTSGSSDTVADNSVDLALVFRNVHSVMRGNRAEEFFAEIFDAVKPGGALGIVQHRGKPGTDVETMKKTAYVTEAQVIELAELAGFELAAKSEINANPRDTKDYPRGVWTLPPSLREGDKDRAKYVAIGESDRMTLRFVKPAE